MHHQETPNERSERLDREEIDLRRKQEWTEYKRSSNVARKVFITALFVMAIIAFTLALKVSPMSSEMKEQVASSWQFKSLMLLGIILGLYWIWAGEFLADRISFVELDERNRFEKSRNNTSPNHVIINNIVEQAADGKAQHKTIDGEKSRKAVSGFDFVEHMRSIIESLDYQIDYSEEKASRLLEVGRGFVRGGIWLYVINIVVWQAYLYYINFVISAGVIAGMVSSTMIFVIMEFLGAWYLKQYRHYGDSAFSYMKVRSSYNKYMLAYCAIVEFTTDDLPKAKEDMLRVLAESEKWPELKDVNSNDFNYMLQSVESMGTVFEKLKGVFGRSNSTGAAP